MVNWDNFSQDSLGNATLIIKANETTPGTDYPQALTLQNTKSGTISIRYKWIKGVAKTTSTVKSKYNFHDYSSSSSPSLTISGNKVHNKFGGVLKPSLPSEYILASTNNNPTDKTYVGAFVGAVSKNVVTVVYNRSFGTDFNLIAETFMGAFLKGLKVDSGYGVFSVAKKLELDLVFDGQGKYKNVLKTEAKATVSGKVYQIVALTCNMRDEIMLNFVLMTPDSVLQNKHYTALCDIATSTEASLY